MVEILHSIQQLAFLAKEQSEGPVTGKLLREDNKSKKGLVNGSDRMLSTIGPTTYVCVRG